VSGESLLEVRGLEKHYPITEGVLRREVGRVRAVDGISFSLRRGETLGIVGESGCGKSTAATALLRLEEPTGGSVVFDGREVTAFDDDDLHRFRRRAQLVFQDPSSSFDPRMTVGESVAEPLVIHGIRDRDRRRAIVEDLLERVGLSPADYDRYPHEFSGGQKQRLGIARALVVNPDLIVADEPTSALDVSVQAEILRLIERVQDEFGVAILLISHDMGVIREVCDRVAVMYLGEFVETAATDELFAAPQHPYTRALLSSIPEPDPRRRGWGTELRGDVPSPSAPPSGCRFHTRCPEVIQPADLDLPDEEWRATVALYHRVASRAVDVAAARAFVAGDRDVDPGSVDDDAVARAVRDEFGLPATLADPEAEATLADALAAALADDWVRAVELLDGTFGTVCRDRTPESLPTGAGHEAACHLHDPAVDADPPWREPDATATDDTSESESGSGSDPGSQSESESRLDD
jgi:peptide/nickel transport system ATP-binding protein